MANGTSSRGDRYKYGAILVALIAGIGFLELKLLPGVPTVLVVSFFAIACAAETAAMLRASGADPFAKSSLGLAIALVCAVALPRLQIGFGVIGPLGVLQRFRIAELALFAFVLFCVAAVLRQKTQNAAQTLGGGALVIAVPACLLAMLDVRFFAGEPTVGGIQLLLFLVGVSKVGDIAGYIAGSNFGKHTLIPAVSPGKTWEGSIASLLAATGLASLFGAVGFCGPLTVEACVFGGIAINISSQFGDLAESLLKRSAGLKDSGKWLPQFGGAFDMVDSLFLAAPVFYGFLRVAA